MDTVWCVFHNSRIVKTSLITNSHWMVYNFWVNKFDYNDVYFIKNTKISVLWTMFINLRTAELIGIFFLQFLVYVWPVYEGFFFTRWEVTDHINVLCFWHYKLYNLYYDIILLLIDWLMKRKCRREILSQSRIFKFLNSRSSPWLQN